jgi:hypothetical protein
MEPDERWLRFRDALGRDPTRIEEELAIHLIRTGHLHTVEEIIFGQRPFTCPIGALTPVADLILEKWNSMERTHQEGVRSSLEALLWQVRGPKVSGTYQDAYRALNSKLDMDLILRGIAHASEVWADLDREQRQEIRKALQSFRRWAIVARE